MGKVAFVFPGQGAQYVGMGKEISDNYSQAKEVFQEASDSLNIDMEKLCFSGPEEDLVRTENTQPAILTASVAVLRALESQGVDCSITAGLSLGEYTSLVKSDVFKFSDAVRVVRNRGKYMQEAVPFGIGTMAAILGLSSEAVDKCIEQCKKHGVVEVANYNSPGQIVISGEVEAVKAAVSVASEMGAKKAVILPVSAPFHCSLLESAGVKLQSDLEKVSMENPKIPVVRNINAEILTSKNEVLPSLVKQVSKSVQWEDSVKLMLNRGVDTFVEIGPGKTLSAFIKRISKNENKKVNTYNIDSMKDLDNFLSKHN